MKAITQLPISFAFQSYLDALYESAILAQPTNELIVPSTKRTFQGRVMQIGSAGYSQAPIAVRAYGGANETGVFILRPGQSIRLGSSTGIEYGLPFGWLGGGLATLVIGESEDAHLDLGPSSRPEIIFHRFRTVIEASAANLPALKRNWPLQFPWTRATFGAADADQGGNPILRVEPTRTLLRLRSAIAADKSVSVVFRGSREFDESSVGAYALTNLTSTFVEMTFRASTDPLLPLYPSAMIPENFPFTLACDEGGVTLLDLGDATLTGVEVDVVRFGRL